MNEQFSHVHISFYMITYRFRDRSHGNMFIWSDRKLLDQYNTINLLSDTYY